MPLLLLSAKDNQDLQQSASRPSTSSSAKLIEICSKPYKPLSELKNLKGCGVLDDEEYATEKATIMDLPVPNLKVLNTNDNNNYCSV